MAIKTVALIGTNGNLSAEVLRVLVLAGCFQVTMVKRQSSVSSIPRTIADQDVRTTTVDDGVSLESLKAALDGQEAVVTCIPLRELAQHLRIADAAAFAGVKRVIPADYGRRDSDSPRAQQLVPLFKLKVAVRARLQQLAAIDPNFSWTSIVCGHIFDWGLKNGFLHFDLETKAADILDAGFYKSSTPTLGRVCEAIITILARDDERTRNRVVFMQSFCRATSTEWNVRYVDSGEFIEEHKTKADAGAERRNREMRNGFSTDLLGPREENLDEAVGRVVSSEIRSIASISHLWEELISSIP
ncbi:NmrA-like family protein [Xylariaceae sp. FL1651]|nr:NmrA-like family protein [Xylariaceae sp. FL1651]